MTRLISVAGCCVPYAFICLWGDVTYGTMLFYPVMIPVVCLLARRARRISPALFAGHALSFASSCVCLLLFRTERWSWYFKPFSAFQFMAAQSLIALMIHLFLCRRRRRS